MNATFHIFHGFITVLLLLLQFIILLQNFYSKNYYKNTKYRYMSYSTSCKIT